VGDVVQGQLLWEPPADARTTTRMGRYLDEVEASTGRSLPTYADAHAWSVADLPAFWRSIADHLGVRFDHPPSAVLADASMPGAVWFPDATLNYAELALRRRDDEVAIVGRSQTRGEVTVTWAQLADQVARAAAGLRRLGVGRGDRVVGYLPNVPETVVAFLACASIGAIWSSCAPEFGATSVVDRVRQIEPTVLLVVDGYRYGAKDVDRRAEVAEIRGALPTLRATVLLPYLDPGTAAERVPDATTWEDLLAEPADLVIEPVPFDHPLYVLYSSGTTGVPKAIVHGHGGITLEHGKVLALHHDLGPGEVFCWFTTTGWMMWNYLVSGLLTGARIVTFDGDPGHPDLMTLWELAAETGCTVFGVGAPFLMNSRRAGLTPGADLDLSRLRGLGSTGAPLPPEGFGWVYDAVKDDVLLSSASGGTDVCSAFVAGAPLLPVHAGEIAGPALGCDVQAFDPQGRPVVGRRGELVIVQPMPSMPVGFWNDDDGSRYREAYFAEFPGVWRHGDWLEVTAERGTMVITGRSDATLNRGGVRMGTSEFYAVVEDVPGIVDSLVVHLDDGEGGAGQLLLFVVLGEGRSLDDDLRGELATAIRGRLSPRHVPDDVHVVPAVPRTISGKKMEVPAKRLLEGEPLDEVATTGAMQDPSALDAFVTLARGS
jgi:acetoacetyl-CoA synthetase